MTKEKDRWIKETQMFQRISRSGRDADSYESLSIEYDKDMQDRQQRKHNRKNK